MRIYGDLDSPAFKSLEYKPGMLWWKNEVLIGHTRTVEEIRYIYTGELTNPFSATWEIRKTSTEPKVYLHISRTFWSSFTGLLREYCLPWRWKVAYLEREGSPLKKILIYASVRNGDLSDCLKKIIGQTPLVAKLINQGTYREIYGKEFLQISQAHGNTGISIVKHSLGKGKYEIKEGSLLYPIYRVRGVFSRVMYYALRTFSSEWREIILYADKARDIYESVLIKAAHEKVFAHAGFTKGKKS